MSLVRKHQSSSRGLLSQALLNELAAARNCLVAPETRRAYDEQLRHKPASAPLARVVTGPIADQTLATLPGAVREPPVAASLLSSVAQAEATAAVEKEPSDGESEPSSLGSLAMMFFGMAAAVVLVAGGTFAIGRYFWQRREQPQHSPSVSDPVAEVNRVEKNPAQASSKMPAVRQSPHQGVVVIQEGSRDVNLMPATAVLSGGVQLEPTGSDELLTQWSLPGDEAVWTFKLLAPGFFQLELTYAALAEAGETPLTAIVDETEVETFALRPTGGLDKWSTKEHTIVVSSSGQHRLALRLDGELGKGSLVVKQARLTPAGAAPAERY